MCVCVSLSLCVYIYIEEKKPYDTRPNERRRRSNGMLMSDQNHRISIYCSHYSKQASTIYQLHTKIQTTITTVAMTTTKTTAVASLSPSSLPTTTTAIERSRGERARAERMSCKAFLCMPYVPPRAQYHSLFFPFESNFFRCCFERK